MFNCDKYHVWFNYTRLSLYVMHLHLILICSQSYDENMMAPPGYVVCDIYNANLLLEVISNNFGKT